MKRLCVIIIFISYRFLRPLPDPLGPTTNTQAINSKLSESNPTSSASPDCAVLSYDSYILTRTINAFKNIKMRKILTHRIEDSEIGIEISQCVSVMIGVFSPKTCLPTFPPLFSPTPAFSLSHSKDRNEVLTTLL